MGKKIKAQAIIFDKDGTLLDFDALWVSLSVTAIGALLRQLNQDESVLDKILEEFGIHNNITDINGVIYKGTYTQMAQIVHRILKKDGEIPSVPEIETMMREAYNENVWTGNVKPTCPNIRDVLMHFKNQNKKLAVITTDNLHVTMFCLEKLGIADLFDKIYTDDGAFNTKPHPDCALDFCNTFGFDRQSVVMVGDTITDITFAKNAGIGMIGVAKTENNKRVLEKETEIVISDISKLLEILR